MSLQENSIYVFHPIQQKDHSLKGGTTQPTFGPNIPSYRPDYSLHCWTIDDKPHQTRIYCTINDQPTYLVAPNAAEGSVLHCTTDDSLASLFCIVERRDGTNCPWNTIELLDSDGLETGFFVNYQSDNNAYLNTYHEGEERFKWVVNPENVTFQEQVLFFIHSQQDLKVLTATTSNSVGLQLLLPNDDQSQQFEITFPATGGSLQNGVANNVLLENPNLGWLTGTASGQAPGLQLEAGNTRWHLEDDGAGNIMIQSIDEQGNSIGWLENNLDQLRLNGEKTESTKQKWKFQRSSDGMTPELPG
jgi:hypothetical protein